MINAATTLRPPWLRRRVSVNASTDNIERLLRESNLHTVCEEAACTNRHECFKNSTATFLILGDHCTRNCRFCAVRHGPKAPPDSAEPKHVAEAAEKLGLKYVVLTSVTRDDLSDGGADHFEQYILPAVFEKWRQEALSRGFTGVASGPFVRSPYQAASLFNGMKSQSNHKKNTF